MANGYGSSGPGNADKSSERLFCSKPDFTPTAIVGGTGHNGGRLPRVPLSLYSGGLSPDIQIQSGAVTTDWSMELWVKRLYPDSITTWQTDGVAASGYSFSGVTRIDDDEDLGITVGAELDDHGTGIVAQCAGVWFRGGNFECIYGFDTTPAENTISRTLTLPFGWHHIAITYDRDGNMLSYVDGVLQGTDDISSFTTHLLTGGSLFAGHMDYTNANTFGKVEAPYLIAGMAIHGHDEEGGGSERPKILSNAEIEASVRGNTFYQGNETVISFFAQDAQPDTASGGAWVDVDNAVDTNAAAVTAEIPYVTKVIRDTALSTPAHPWTTGIGNIYPRNKYSNPDGPDASWQAARLNGEGYSLADIGTGGHAPSPIFVYDPSWPPVQGVGGSPYA